MPFVKNYFYKIIFLSTLLCFLVSCGSEKYFQTAAGNNKNEKFPEPSALLTQDNNPPDLYKRARHSFLKENYTHAAALFTKFIKNNPKDSLADNAAYWLGECHYYREKYTKAILTYKNLVRKYPASEKVSDAVLKTGVSYYSLYDLDHAYHYLKQVITRYPFSPAAEKAREIIKDF